MMVNHKITYIIICIISLLHLSHPATARSKRNDKVAPVRKEQPPKKQPVDIQTELAIHIFYPGDIQTRFADIAGLEIAKACLSDIISYLKDSSKYDAIGAKITKGILLEGSTGNGKTMLARAFAGECNCPFISINGSSFIEMYVGVGPARVRELFQIARKLAPCVIFIDEIDALIAKRMSESSKEYNNTVNAFLTEVDGLFNDNKTVVIMGATNRIDILDEAAIRPGRFDRKIYISKPTFDARLQLLTQQLTKVKHDPYLDITYIAQITTGFSGAELSNLINDAALIAVHKNCTYITMEHIQEALHHMKQNKR